MAWKAQTHRALTQGTQYKQKGVWGRGSGGREKDYTALRSNMEWTPQQHHPPSLAAPQQHLQHLAPTEDPELGRHFRRYRAHFR